MKPLYSRQIFLFLFITLSCCISGLAQTPFTDVTVSAGITDPADPSLNRKHVATEYPTGMNIGTGAAWTDYDNDGSLDLYFTNREAPNLMYHNNGDGTFTEVAVSLGIADASGDGSGVAFADYDNDGWDDLFLCNGFGDRLFRNNNGTSFTDVTTSAGFDLNNERRSTSASWADYDNDGFLDLYIARHFAIYTADPNTDSQDQLFHNNGDGTFTDVSDLFTTNEILGAGFIGGWFDFDKDGDVDLMLINDCPFLSQPMRLFRNDGGTNGITDWNFVECSVSVGIDRCDNGMGIAIGDYNRDGWMDIYYSNIGPAVFFENNAGTFTNVTDDLGVGNQDAGRYSWGTSFLDHNNDGWQDLVLVSGGLADENSPTYSSANYFYENNGDDTFSDISIDIEMGDSSRARTVVCGDYDNDGDLDVFILKYNERVNLRQNNNDNNYHWTTINLTGVSSNQNGIGSKIKLTTPDNVVQYFETRSGSSLGGGDAINAHFGLKDNTNISEIEVTWPSGIVQTETNLNVDQLINLTEPDAPLPVEWSSFSAIAKNKATLVSWTTFNEDNNQHFIIQRSTDGREFKNIGKVDGAGSSSHSSTYQFIDSQVNPGDNYYRLKQVDFNGASDFSAVVHLYFQDKEPAISIIPNPVTGNSFELQTNHDANAQIALYDVVGNLIWTKHNVINKVNIPTHDLSNGVYFIRVQTASGNQGLKVMLNR